MRFYQRQHGFYCGVPSVRHSNSRVGRMPLRPDPPEIFSASHRPRPVERHRLQNHFLATRNHHELSSLSPKLMRIIPRIPHHTLGALS
jgi:hypothetical protein